MRITFDPARNAKNIAERALPFDRVQDFDWSTALVVEDVRRDHGEARYQAMGLIDGRLHMVVFTARAGAVHVISFRKANAREVKQYEKSTQPQQD